MEIWDNSSKRALRASFAAMITAVGLLISVVRGGLNPSRTSQNARLLSRSGLQRRQRGRLPSAARARADHAASEPQRVQSVLLGRIHRSERWRTRVSEQAHVRGWQGAVRRPRGRGGCPRSPCLPRRSSRIGPSGPETGVIHEARPGPPTCVAANSGRGATEYDTPEPEHAERQFSARPTTA
jgi:hypothetical protein